MSALFTVDARLEGFETVKRALAKLDPLPAVKLMTRIARIVREQVRRRVTSEKTAPSGEAWKPNREGRSTLYRSGTLARSIDYSASSDAAIVGSGLVYAGVHQHGATIVPKKAKRLVFRMGNRTIFARKVTIPARPYLGLSAENAEDVLDQVGRFLQARIGGAR
jgi:phage virion morphogenesis protein